jgi:hypothetical protein
VTTIPLTLAAVLPYLEHRVADLACQQITDPNHPDSGALISPEYGMTWGQLDAGFVTGVAYQLLGAVALGDERRIAAAQALLPAALLAVDAMIRAQRPSGLLDLITVNYDSSPDTGFTVQQLCTVVELARLRATEVAATLAKSPSGDWPQPRQVGFAPVAAVSNRRADSNWAALLSKIAQFIRRAVPGMMDGGFHTPNHRWVIAAALSQAARLFPDLDVRRAVDAYLAEGVDLDAEGFFIERSVGVYDAVNDRSLLLIAENYGWPGALEAVERNLNLDLRLLHADGTAETGLSRRQDYGTREVALGLAPCFLLSHGLRPNPTFSRAAGWLWEQAPTPVGHLEWLLYPLLKYGDPAAADATAEAVPDDFTLHLPANGIYRVRRGLLSASFFRDATRLLSFTFGAAELTSLKISATYFGGDCGHFIGDRLEVKGGRAVLWSEGRRRARRPGYELPFGRPVPPERWAATTVERELRRLPPLFSLLEAQEATDDRGRGFDLRLRTLDGLHRVAVQIAFDFPPGGVWETADTRIKPAAGQTIFLKQGYGAMRYGNDAIEIGPGAAGHGMWQMREAEPAPNHVRVLLAFLTPVDHAFTIRAYRGLGRSS